MRRVICAAQSSGRVGGSNFASRKYSSISVTKPSKNTTVQINEYANYTPSHVYIGVSPVPTPATFPVAYTQNGNMIVLSLLASIVFYWVCYMIAKLFNRDNDR